MSELIYRKNYLNKIVECGKIEFLNGVFSIVLHSNISSKFEFPYLDFYFYKNKMILKTKNKDDLYKYIHKINDEYYLNDFNRKKKIKKDRNRKKNEEKISKELLKNLKIINEKNLKENKKKKNENLILKKKIISNNKSKNKLNIDIFSDTDKLGTFADIFPKEFKSKEFLENEYYENLNEETIDITNNLTEVITKRPKKSTLYKNKIKEHKKLVLWDIENVNFYDDFAIITRILPKDSDKIYSYSKKNHKGIYLKNNNIDFLLNKLRKRKWIEKRTTKIADDVLINEFNLRKDKINELYVISSDKDFKEICDIAISKNIKVYILNNNKNNINSWFNNDKYNYISLNEKIK